VQKWHVVQIGSKVGALDALRLRERFATKCMPLGIVGRRCGTQLGANLVFLQDQPSSPLPRARLKMLRYRGIDSM
jgi:hypothetical protein